MTTDIQMKVRGLCETLASAYASAAACHQALAEIVGIGNQVGRLHHTMADCMGSFNVDAILADSLAAAEGAADAPEWDGLGEVA